MMTMPRSAPPIGRPACHQGSNKARRVVQVGGTMACSCLCPHGERRHHGADTNRSPPRQALLELQDGHDGKAGQRRAMQMRRRTWYKKIQLARFHCYYGRGRSQPTPQDYGPLAAAGSPGAAQSIRSTLLRRKHPGAWRRGISLESAVICFLPAGRGERTPPGLALWSGMTVWSRSRSRESLVYVRVRGPCYTSLTSLNHRPAIRSLLYKAASEAMKAT